MVTKTSKTVQIVPSQQEREPEPSLAPQLEVESTGGSWITDDMYDYENITPALQAIYVEMGMVGGSETTVHVSKVDGIGRGEEAGVFRGPPEDYDLERIAKDFGSGKYRVKVYIKNERGMKVIKGSKVFSWLLSPAQEAERQAKENPPQAVTFGDLEKILSRVMQPPAAPPAMDPMKMFELFTSMFAKMQPPAPPPPADPMQTFKMAFEIADRMKGNEQTPRDSGSNTNDIIIALADNFGPALTSVLQEKMRLQRQAEGMTAADPAAIGMQQQPQPEPQPPQQLAAIATPGGILNQQEIDALAPGVAFLVMQAEQGNPVETYAEMILDNVPAEALQGMLKAPNPVAVLQEVNENVSKYQEWFTELLDQLRVLLSDVKPDGDEKV